MSLIQAVVNVAHELRDMDELNAGLSVRATDEACTYLKHPLMEDEQFHHLGEVLKSSFCGRFSGRWSDAATDAGVAWQKIRNILKKKSKT